MENLIPLSPNDKKPKRRASKKQIKANRRNGILGGPKSMRGRKRVSKNAITHGLLSRAIVVKEFECQKDFDDLFSGLIEFCDPFGPIEMMLIEKIAVAWWRLKRVAVAEVGTIIMNQQKDVHFEEIKASLGMAEATDEDSKKGMIPYPQDAKNLLRYETTFERQFYRALDQLERHQRLRKGETIPPPINLNVLTENK